jgi:hypothetical protein
MSLPSALEALARTNVQIALSPASSMCGLEEARMHRSGSVRFTFAAAAALIVIGGASAAAQTTVVHADAVQEVMSAQYGGGAVGLDSSNFIQTVNGGTTLFHGVNVSTTGSCTAFGGGTGAAPFLSLSSGGTAASVSATIAGAASFDGGMNYVAGTITITATASSSDPQRLPSSLRGTLRQGNTIAEQIQLTQFVHPADAGSVTVLFDGAPCASGPLDNGSLTIIEQRSNGRIKP